MGGFAEVDPALVGEREVDEGNLTVLPDPGRSDSPPPGVLVGLRVGIPVTESPLFLVGPYDLTMTSSFVSGLAVIGFGRLLSTRSRTLPGEFSLRIGEPRRVGVGIEDACLVGDGVLREGVRGEALIWRLARDGESGPRGVCGDHEGTSLASCNVLRSLKEERRFLRGGPAVDGTSPIVPRAPRNDRPLALLFSNVNAPSTVGRSLEEGRFGERRAVSVEFERARGAGPAFDRLEGWLSLP